MKDYLLNNKISIFKRLLVLLLPIFLGGWIILSEYKSFDYFKDLSHYNINSVFIGSKNPTKINAVKKA